jgi:hypothetical protein
MADFDQVEIKDIVTAAVHRTVHNSGMKPKQIAAATGIDHNQLLSKANLNIETANISVIQAAMVENATGTRYISNAYKLLLHDEGELSLTDAGGVMTAVLKAAVSHGDIHRVIKESIENDQLIDFIELQDCISVIQEGVRGLMELQEAVTHAAKNKITINQP